MILSSIFSQLNDFAHRTSRHTYFGVRAIHEVFEMLPWFIFPQSVFDIWILVSNCYLWNQTKVYEKRNDFNSPIVYCNFSAVTSSVPSHMVYTYLINTLCVCIFTIYRLKQALLTHRVLNEYDCYLQNISNGHHYELDDRYNMRVCLNSQVTCLPVLG